MNEKEKEVVDFWLSNAKEDIESAQIMLSAKKYLYVGFMLQQCMEKALKAYFIFKNKEQHPFTHNLLKLTQTTQLDEILNKNQRQLILRLSPLYIETRYLEYKSNISSILTQAYCEKLLTETEELYVWIKELMI